MRYSIELRTRETTAEILEKISANTERELVPFVSAARQTNARGVKPFVSSTSGNRFRVWCVPIASKPYRRSYRYLRGEIREVNGERHILGSFGLHPVQVIFELFPLVFAVLIWDWGNRSTRIFIIPLLCVFGFVMFASALRPRPQEEADILAFLRGLFRDARSDLQ